MFRSDQLCVDDECESFFKLIFTRTTRDFSRSSSGGSADAEFNGGEWRWWQPEVKFSSAARSRGVGGVMVVDEGGGCFV